MRYREARLLKPGDEVIRKEDNLTMMVTSVEAYGQFKTVKINCSSGDIKDTLFNDEVM